MKPQLSPGRPVPQVFRHVIQFDWFRRYTFLERVKILFGFNFMVYVRIPCRHNAASFEPIVKGDVTRHITPDDVIVEQMKKIMVDQPAQM